MHELKVPPPKPTSLSPQDESQSTFGRIDSLTGLRFIAALLVFVHHFQGRFGFTGTGLPLANNAVSFFFVLSGFILTLVYARRFEGSSRSASVSAADVISFLKKRFARLWPLHFVCLLICVATVRYLNLDFWVIVTNLFLVHSWTGHAPYVTGLNNVSWSISTELFFCFAFPLLVMRGYHGFLWRYGFLILATLGCLILLNFAISYDWISKRSLILTIQANPLMRLLEFATGILTAYLFTRAPKRIDRGVSTDTAFEIGALGLVVTWWVFFFKLDVLTVVFSAPMIGHALSTWMWFCSAAPLFGIVIWTFARSNGLISKFMASPAMVHLGEISFAFYMIHMLVMRVIDLEGDPFLITGTLAIVLSLVASLAAAELLYQLVEMPCKDGMNALLNGRTRDSFVKSAQAIRQVLFKPLTAIAALALMAVAGFVHQNSLTKYEQAKIRQIVQESSETHKQVDFDGVAQLHGCLLNVDDNSIKVELAWKLSDLSSQNQYSLKRRTIYLMDESMKPLKVERIAWPFHIWSSKSGETYDLIEFDRSEFPDLHRIMLAWEDNHGQSATLAKNGNSSSFKLLELHCVEPELAAIDTFSLPPGKLRSLIEQMPQSQPYIRLGNNATLCGYECLPNPDGGLSVNLAWKLKPELTERRVLNFLDENTAVVGSHGDVAMLQFVRRVMTGPEEKLFLDQISVPSEEYKGASTVALGLWNEKAKKMVQIEKGQTVSKGKRLIIGQIENPATPR